MLLFGEDLRDRYEEARACAIGLRPCASKPEGLALILSRGVPDWMNTWSHILPANKSRSPEAREAKMNGDLPPEDLRPQITRVLVRMAIRRTEEAVAC